MLKIKGVKNATNHNPPLALNLTKNLFLREKTFPFLPLLI